MTNFECLVNGGSCTRCHMRSLTTGTAEKGSTIDCQCSTLNWIEILANRHLRFFKRESLSNQNILNGDLQCLVSAWAPSTILNQCSEMGAEESRSWPRVQKGKDCRGHGWMGCGVWVRAAEAMTAAHSPCGDTRYPETHRQGSSKKPWNVCCGCGVLSVVLAPCSQAASPSEARFLPGTEGRQDPQGLG